MPKPFLVAVAPLVLLVATVSPAPTTSAVESCLDWDLEHYPATGRAGPVIDRLASGQPPDDLLARWLADNCLRMNQVQVLGTHNSYHVQPLDAVLGLVRLVLPEAAAPLEYTHRPLDEQLGDLRVRQVELDVFVDPAGGLFANPVGPLLVDSADPQADMGAPGLKVLHIQDIDYRHTCPTFVACLQVVRTWSQSHPWHLPILVLVEAKDDPLVTPVPSPIPLTVPVPFGAAELDQIDAEIRSVFGPEQLITPDDVRGSRPTLEEAILIDGWPTLNEARGRVIFAFDNEDARRETYLAGHPSLAGRVMFTSSPPGRPESAFVKVNDPETPGAAAQVRSLVEQGYLVRTRADADTVEARLGSTARRDAALASGAQFVSTDFPASSSFPIPDPRYPGYSVSIPGDGPGRCNPVLAPPGCTSAALEVIPGLERRLAIPMVGRD